MSNENQLTVKETSLSVNLDDKAIASLDNQRKSLRKFISTQLQKDSDYGLIPGVKKDSLYKPGAEKLANIFQLGSRILKTDKTIDIDKNFAMFAITVEVFHIPSGKAIAQCEGISNSYEKKYKTRKNYNFKPPKEEETPIGDILNTLVKMAQKRAYVGAVIIACGASDFFTQDVEDMPREYFGSNETKPETKEVRFAKSETKQPEVFNKGIKDSENNSDTGQVTFDAGNVPDRQSPVSEDKPAYTTTSSSGDAYRVPFGKEAKGKTLEEIGETNVIKLAQWCDEKLPEFSGKLKSQAEEYIRQAEAWLSK